MPPTSELTTLYSSATMVISTVKITTSMNVKRGTVYNAGVASVVRQTRHRRCRQERRRQTVRLTPAMANATTARIMLDTAEPVAAIESLFDASWSGFVPSASPG